MKIVEKVFDMTQTFFFHNLKFQRFLRERPSVNLFLKKIQFDGPSKNYSYMQKGWLTVIVFVKFLHLDNLTVSTIRKDAFNAKQFVNLNELVIQSHITCIEEFAFMGLENLKKLTLRGIEIISFAPKTLGPLGTLQWLTIESCVYSENSKMLSLKNLLGILSLYTITRVKIIDCNVQIIDRSSFHGLTGINELMLVNDQIENIRQESFDIVFVTLTYLNLVGNRLRTLPSDLFNIEQSLMATIKLDSNLWHCDCDLESLRQFILNSFNEDVKQAICRTPFEYAGRRIYDLPSLCNDQSTPSPPSPSPFPTEIIIPDDQDYELVHSHEPKHEHSNDSTIIHCGAINVNKYVTLGKLTKIQFPSIRIKNGNLVLYTAHL